MSGNIEICYVVSLFLPYPMIQSTWNGRAFLKC